MIMVLDKRATGGEHTLDYVTCRFVRIIDFTLMPLTRYNCLTQDFPNMSDTCKGCEKRSIFALKRLQRAEQARHQRISAQLCSLNLAHPDPWALYMTVKRPIWMAAILHLMLVGDTRVSECQEEKFPPHVEAHGTALGQKLGLQWTHRAKAVANWPDLCLCLPWNQKLQGPFLMTNRCLYGFSSPWSWGREPLFDDALWLTLPQLSLNFNPVQTNIECGLNLGPTKCLWCNKLFVRHVKITQIRFN